MPHRKPSSPKQFTHNGTDRQTSHFALEPADNLRLAILSGQFDEHIHLVEQEMGVEISNRGCKFQVIGKAPLPELTKRTLLNLYELTAQNTELKHNQIHFEIQQQLSTLEKKLSRTKQTTKGMIIHTPFTDIKPMNKNQEDYLENIYGYDITFGVGPAGTGKTYLAVACAVEALAKDSVKRIILARPVVEAGEKLGFLPGDLAQKVDPYLRPIYDALYEMLGIEEVNKMIERGIIEIAPLAYMRGRTLNDAFIILDESQNSTKEQMKMFLTRIGFGSKMVITGDITQIDLPSHQLSGLRHATEVFRDTEAVSFTFFQAADAVRHPVVQQLIQAYEGYQKQ